MTEKKELRNEKNVPISKLPGLLKKSYTQEAFQKKILKRLFIETDKELIMSLFIPDTANGGQLRIPAETVLTKKEFKHLKAVAVQIKKQKGRIKLVPLAAVCIFLAAVGITVSVFRNVFVKNAIIGGMEQTFGAEADIASVDLRIFNASLQINGIAQTDKNKPMKNLFKVDNVTLDFNLTELLRGKFDVQNMQVTGIAFGTNRKTPGKLSEKAKKQQENTAFSKLVNSKADAMLTTAKSGIGEIFSQYNPQTVVNGLGDKLRSPQIAQDIQTNMEKLLPEWKNTADDIESSVTSFSSDVKTILNTNWKKIDNAGKLTEALKTVQDAVSKGKNLKEKTERTLTKLKTDSATVRQYSGSIRTAVNNDKTLVRTELDKISAFSPDDSRKIITDSLDPVMYRTLGTYYPYLQQAVLYASKLKSDSSGSKNKTGKTSRRMTGRTIYYKKDSIPSFLIERADVSGTVFSVAAHDISNNPDIRGAPAVINGKLKLDDRQIHTFNVVVDGRSTTGNPLIAVNYTGTNPVSAHVPTLTLTAQAGIDIAGTADTDGGFSAKSTIDLHSVQLDTEPFEPELAYTLYKKALSSITTMKLYVTAAYTSADGIKMDISSDADRQVSSALNRLMNSELKTVREKARTEIATLLEKQTGTATGEIAEYLDIEKAVNSQSTILNAINGKLAAKQNEIEKELQQTAAKAAKQAAGQLLKKLF